MLYMQQLSEEFFDSIVARQLCGRVLASISICKMTEIVVVLDFSNHEMITR